MVAPWHGLGDSRRRRRVRLHLLCAHSPGSHSRASLISVPNIDAQLIDPLMALQLKAREQMTAIDWTITPNLTATATMAQTATKCIVFGSSLSGEGWDRNVTLMHDGDVIINAVADNCAKTIVVIHTVGPVDMEVCSLHRSANPGVDESFA